MHCLSTILDLQSHWPFDAEQATLTEPPISHSHAEQPEKYFQKHKQGENVQHFNYFQHKKG